MLLLLSLFSFTVSAKAALDLAPVPSEYDGEGVKYTRLAFKDDKRQVLYVPPLNWSYRGSSSQLRLTPPSTFTRTDAVIDTVPLAAPQPLDEKAMAAISQQCVSALPPGSQEIKVVSEEFSPLLIAGNIPTYEVTASYQIYGETYVRSVLFANLAETQLRFKLSALKKDFDVLHRQFRKATSFPGIFDREIELHEGQQTSRVQFRQRFSPVRGFGCRPALPTQK